MFESKRQSLAPHNCDEITRIACYDERKALADVEESSHAVFCDRTNRGGFLAGWTASRRLTLSIPGHLARVYLTDKGDAPEAVRGEVLKLVRAFEDGYIKRDVRSLDRFTSDLFLPGTSVVVLGTDPGEWINGYASVKRFIKSDWLGWGDLRLVVDGAAVYSTGDVAWLATVGTVASGRFEKPVRLTAVMTRTNARWFFRQLHPVG